MMKLLGRMDVRTGLAASIFAAGTFVAAGAYSATVPATAEASPQMLAQVKTPAGRAQFVQTYCQGCHNAKAKAGGLVLEGIDTANLAGNDEI
jgi:mono/diheme cytochrome c family protein